MWTAKLKWKHDCIIGNRCKKFNVTAIGIPMDVYEGNGYYHYLHFQKLSGDQKDINAFIKDIKKDNEVNNLEFEDNSIFFIVKKKINEKIPTTHYDKKIFFLKPVIVDTKGYEHWEIASWKKEFLAAFINGTKKDTIGLQNFKLLSIEQNKLTELYFPQLLPKLTNHQKNAFELAVKEGYYEFPRKIELLQLSKIMNKSLSTYREHLRIAEKKIMPVLGKNIE